MSVRNLVAGLNDRQRQAVETTKGPCLILAGPGSGKTRVVTSRICYLLEQGVAPSQILAITFTKKAAEEMRERVAKMLGNLPSGLTICTFHSLGFRILRQHAAVAGLEPEFEVLSQRKQLQIVTDICHRFGDESKPEEVLAEISRLKNIGCSADAESFVADAYPAYDEELRQRNAIDLDDMIFRTLTDVLEPNPDIATSYARRYRYIMIDEYQDTNGTQFELTKCILPAKRNLCVVGDDDQSIYGFRGSNVEHILNFADDFPGTRLIKLETNYRSTPQIVDMASEVIEMATNRYPKRLTADQHSGDPVEVQAFGDEEDEKEYILSALRYSPDDVAILFRGNEEAQRMRNFLSSRGVRCGERDAVKLLTLHAAKGLEFDTVFIPSLEQDNIPHAYGSPEEERRLFYVGMTRAKRHLHLSCCRERKGRPREPSKFVTEFDA